MNGFFLEEEKRMRIVIAPDSFKGSLSALEAARAMERGIRKVFPDAECDLLPLADGGEGTVDALVNATGGSLYAEDVHDPLGRPIKACWGLLGDGHTAVVEMAAASGLPLLGEDERNPLVTSTFGTGELIKAALAALHERDNEGRLIIGIGGSATNDGGVGALQALGAKFFNAGGEELPTGGAALADLAFIDTSTLDPLLGKTEILVACDVDNPLTGEHGASAVFGPQKGATPAMVAQLDAALGNYASIAREVTQKDIAGLPGAGAAGGLGAGLLFFSKAQLLPGIEIVLEATNFDTRVRVADLVLTGEGHTDYQTAFGKAPAGVAGAAKLRGKPVICISGGIGTGVEALYAQGIDAIAGAVCSISTLEYCMERADSLLEAATERTFRVMKIGMGLC